MTDHNEAPAGEPMISAPDIPNDEVESETKTTAPGGAPTTEAETPNSSGEKSPAPEIGEAERAASEESRRLAAAEDNEL